MQKTVEDINPTKKRFTVEIPADVLEERINNALREYGKSARLPGFRPGKVPLSLLDKRFGKDAESEVLERVIPEYYLKAVKEENITPVTPPVFEEYDFKRKTPFKMTFTIEVRPEIQEIRYEGLKIKDEKIEATDEDVENTLQRLRLEKSSYEKVDGPIEENDLVVVDYRITEEDKEVKDQFIKVGSDIIPEEISRELLGKKQADSFEVTAPFPENYVNKNFSGKTLTLKGTINEVKRLNEAELNDRFAKDLGYKDLTELRTAVKESVIKAKEELLQNRQKGEIIEQLLKEHRFSIPEGLLETEINAINNEEKRKNPEVDPDAIKDESREKATRNVKLNLILDAVADRQEIFISDEELKKKILELSNSMYITPENFMKMYLPDENAYYYFRQNIIREKTIDYIYERAVSVEEDSGPSGKEESETEPKGEDE